MAGSGSDVVKPEVFDGSSFKRWQVHNKLWLKDLKVFCVIADTPMLFPLDEETHRRWEDANNSALARLLAVLSNRPFDVYFNYTSARELWDDLDQKFSEGDNGNESFIVETYLNFQMTEDMSILEQVQELQLHVRGLHQYDYILPESFQVNVVLAKLPPSWRDFVTCRRHMKHRLPLQELQAAINVEERARAGSKPSSSMVQAHQVEAKDSNADGKKKDKIGPKKEYEEEAGDGLLCMRQAWEHSSQMPRLKGKGLSPNQQDGEVHMLVVPSGSTNGIKMVDRE